MKQQADPPMIVRPVRAGGVVRVNRSFLAKVGFTEAELAQKPFVDWIDADDRQVFRSTIESGGKDCRVRHRTKDGASLLLALQIGREGEGPVVLGRCAESCPATDSHEEADVEATVKGTLHQIAEIIEEQNPGYKCSILLVSHGRFVKGAGPSLPDDYNNAIDGQAIGPTVGSCGTAIYWNVPVIVEDIQKDPLWAPFAALAKKAGVAACWSHPFATKGGRVLGALALYCPEPSAPTSEQISSLRAAAQLTGLAVERGRAEEELRSANEVKARFMANMSHEIRTPLNALIGITDSLEDTQEPAPQSEIRLLSESAEQLLELFTGVLELTEVQDRRHHGSVTDLPAFCRAIYAPFEATAREKGLQIEYAQAKNVPQWVRIDDWAFERALRLLIHNAVKFTDSGTVTVAIDFEDHKLRARITDTGCGIDLDRLSELREPFVQGDLSTTKRYSGFGLGLALSDLCLHALGGKLEFCANKPQGTTASFALPISLATPPVEPDQGSAPVDSESTRLPVLVVEDNPLNSKVLEKILERSGYECELTENGEEAVQALTQSSYCCVLMDCQMPVMDGYEATRRIRQREADTGEHIPIIAVTANALAEDRDLCLQAGMDDYLKKPVRKQELVVALEEHVGCPPEESRTPPPSEG
jgi:signal transduction histidine kinase/CheY-like chemotaxis protein